MPALHILSGGAAQGLVTQLRERFKAEQHCDIAGTFGAVGMMKDKLLAGTPCDVLILTDALIAQLTASGQVVAGSEKDLGIVKTGVAVKSGEKAAATGRFRSMTTSPRSVGTGSAIPTRGRSRQSKIPPTTTSGCSSSGASRIRIRRARRACASW